MDFVNYIKEDPKMAAAIGAGFILRLGIKGVIQRPVLIKQMLPELLKVKPEILPSHVAPPTWKHIIDVAKGGMSSSGPNMMNLTRGLPVLFTQTLVGGTIAALGLKYLSPQDDINTAFFNKDVATQQQISAESNIAKSRNTFKSSDFWNTDFVKPMSKSIAIISTAFAATYPLENIRTRLAADVNTLQHVNNHANNTPGVAKLNNFCHQNAFDAARHIYQHEGGIKGFYRGAQPMFAAYTVGWVALVLSLCGAISLFDDDKTEQQQQKQTDIAKWSTAILAGTAFVGSAPLCIGLETMSRRMMISPLTGTSTQYNGSLSNTFKVMHKMGPNNLSRLSPLLSGWIVASLFTQYCKNDFLSPHSEKLKKLNF